MQQSSEKPLPFHDISYFECFKIGEILELTVWKETEEKTEPLVGPKRIKTRTRLTPWDVLGIYEGPDGDKHIKIRTGTEVVEKIPVASLAQGGLKELAMEQCMEIVLPLLRILQTLPVSCSSKPAHVVGALNKLRQLIDKNALLIPHARI